jgi:hypothetical protein
MLSRPVRRTLTIAGKTALLCATAAPDAGLAQLDGQSAPKFDELADRILAEEAQNGPYSPDLLDPLRELSLIYEERGNHALALGVLDRALQVVRANDGLRALEQAPLIAQSIHNEEARGNFAAAWDLEQDLVDLARRHPGDLRAVPIFRDMGDKRLDMLERYLGGEYPPQIVLGCFYRPPHLPDGNCHAGSKSVAARGIASEAQRHYREAISVLLRNGLYANPDLRELELALLRSTYFHGGPYGRQSLRRLLAYDVANGEPWVTRMQSFLQIVDWDFLYGDKGPVIKTYEQAYNLFKENQAPQAAIDDVFAPRLPVVLPSFLPNPLASAQTQSSRGFIDVSFEITKYGRARGIEILATTTNATDDEQDRLTRLIARSEFRPRVVNGQLADRSPVVLRYYLNDDDPIATPVEPPATRPPARAYRPLFQSG